MNKFSLKEYFGNARNCFTFGLLAFVVFSTFSPRLKYLTHAYFIFIALPFLFLGLDKPKLYFCRFRELWAWICRSRESWAWILFLIWIAVQEYFLAVVTDGRYFKYILYVAIFIMVAGYLASSQIFRSERFLRGSFWFLVVYTLFSVSVDWYKGVWYPGGFPFFMQPNASPYFHPLLLNLLLGLLLPRWILEERWVEIVCTVGAVLFVNALCFASRSSLVGTAAVLFANLVFYAHHRPKLALRYAGILLLLAVLGVIAVHEFTFLHSMLELDDPARLKAAMSHGYTEVEALAIEKMRVGGTIRLMLWRDHLENLVQYNGVLFGLGQKYHRTLRPGLMAAHSLYVSMLVYHGFFALLFWLALCALTLYRAWRNCDPWGIALLAGLAEAAFMSENIVGYPDTFWVIVLLPMGLVLNTNFLNKNSSKQGVSGVSEQTAQDLEIPISQR